jgi:hypothetical protein
MIGPWAALVASNVGREPRLTQDSKGTPEVEKGPYRAIKVLTAVTGQVNASGNARTTLV